MNLFHYTEIKKSIYKKKEFLLQYTNLHSHPDYNCALLLQMLCY